MSNPEMTPLLEQAASGLASASGDLPGNASKTIVNSLLEKGAKFDVADEKGQTPAALAKARLGRSSPTINSGWSSSGSKLKNFN